MRLDALQAAVLRVKLPHVRAWNASRRRIAAMYSEALAGLDGCALPSPSDAHAWHQYVIQAPDRDALRAALAAREIETEAHYPLALHLQPAFKHLGGRAGEHPRAERATREVLSLPIHPMLRDDEITRVIDAVRSFFR
jgi:dTDP-4-amino-4,6-dideoxygalactose transaminase